MPSANDSPHIPPHRGRGGVFITKGARVAIPAGGLRIGFSGGKLDASVTLHVGLNMPPIWAELAVDHLTRAQTAREAVLVAWGGTDDAVLGAALIDEFTASMQAIVAAGIAIDACFAAVRGYAALPDALVQTWQRNRTARYKQVAEVLRRAFPLKPRHAVGVRAAIREIYRFRDWAVHPPAEARAPAHHPDLHMDTEWRFVAFSLPNDRELVRASLSLLWQAANRTDVPSASLRDDCRGLRSLLDPSVTQWETRFGPLTAQPKPRSGGAA